MGFYYIKRPAYTESAKYVRPNMVGPEVMY